LEGQITIVAVAARHEKNLRHLRHLTSGTGSTRDFFGGRSLDTTAKKSREQALFAREDRASRG